MCELLIVCNFVTECKNKKKLIKIFKNCLTSKLPLIKRLMDFVTLAFGSIEDSLEDLFGVSLITNPTHEFLSVTLEHSTPKSFQLDFDAPRPIHTEISASDDAVPGVYKILLGAQSSDVAVSKFITVTIE